MQAVDICNNALDLIGQGTHIDDMQEGSREAVECGRLLPEVIKRLLDKGNFAFARKDEVITEDYLLPDAVSLPWKYTYSIPEDVMRILYLTELRTGSYSETVGWKFDKLRFNRRNYDGKVVLVTDAEAPFVMQYQAYVDDPNLFPPSFCEALEYALAARLAASFVKSTTGTEVSIKLTQVAQIYLQAAISADSQQGLYSVEQQVAPEFIRARR